MRNFSAHSRAAHFRFSAGGKGFTLVELIVVITIMVAMMALAASMLRGGGRAQGLQSAVEMVDGMVQEARLDAMGKGTWSRLIIVSKSKKLLHLTVFDGERERCILSGIAKWFAPEDLIGKKIGIVANLAPRPMMKGKYVSEGMIFAADTDVDGGCSIAFFPDSTPAGARIH